MQKNSVKDNKLMIRNIKLKDLECSICLYLFENPVNDSCRHTFCSKCIKDWLIKRDVCPLSNKKIKNLTPSFFLKSLLAQGILNCLKCSEEIYLKDKNFHDEICGKPKEERKK